MNRLIMAIFVTFLSCICVASQYQYVRMYNQTKITPDDSKIKSCLKGLHASQLQFHKAKGYFATLPNELNLTKYRVCDGLEISTHFVSDNGFRMTAKFNHKIWSVDQSKNIFQQQEQR